MRNHIMPAYFALIAILTFPLVNGQVSGISEKDDIISSATFPSSYGNNIEATHSISVLPNHYLSISFIEFYLEYQSNCGYDSLKIVDTSGKDLFFGCGQMHGQSVPAAENFPSLIETSLGVTITFKTDGSVTQKGFQLKVQQLGMTDQCGTHKKKRSLRTSRAAEGILYLGPGYFGGGESEVFSLDSSGLVTTSCEIPPHPINDIYVSSAFEQDGVLTMCGGYSRSRSPVASRYLSECYKLVNSKWEVTTPLTLAREEAATTMLENGHTLVSGGSTINGDGNTKKTELWTGSRWEQGIELPTPQSAHCLIQLLSGNLFMVGGGSNPGNYLYSDNLQWVKKEDMPTRLYRQSCAKLSTTSEQVWVIGGYDDDSTSIYSVIEDRWSAGPRLPYLAYYPGVITAYENTIIFAGGTDRQDVHKLVNGVTWNKIGMMTRARILFPSLIISEAACYGKPSLTPETPLEVSYNFDGSIAYLSGSLVPLVAQLATDSPGSYNVTCCTSGSLSQVYECGNGVSCSDVCGEQQSGCATIECEECHNSPEKTCSSAMEEGGWCAKASVIKDLITECPTVRKKRAVRTARGTNYGAIPIWRIWFCPRKIQQRFNLDAYPLCCLHPIVRRRNGFSKHCCNKFGLCF